MKNAIAGSRITVVGDSTGASFYRALLRSLGQPIPGGLEGIRGFDKGDMLIVMLCCSLKKRTVICECACVCNFPFKFL